MEANEQFSLLKQIMMPKIPSASSKKFQQKVKNNKSVEEEGETVHKSAVALNPAASREELQARLSAKLETLQVKRSTADPAKVKKRQAQKEKRKQKKEAVKKAHQDRLQKKTTEKSSVVVDGKQIFSKFDFGIGDGKKGKSVTPKNPKQALQKAEVRTAKIDALKAVDATKAEQLQKSEAWAKAIQKAQGLVIKDDPKLLKKSIHKMEKAKEKRTEKWENRQQAVKDSQGARQQKRQENIDARKQQKKGAGGGVQKKRPGFEGGHFKKIHKRK